MQLSEIPLTQQSASEVAQLYLSSNLKTLTAYAEDKQLQGILESLRHEEFYNHTPEEKLKVHSVEPLLLNTSHRWTPRGGGGSIRLWRLRDQKDGIRNHRIREGREGLTPHQACPIWRFQLTFHASYFES